jgi:hypothetical protein
MINTSCVCCGKMLIEWWKTRSCFHCGTRVCYDCLPPELRNDERNNKYDIYCPSCNQIMQSHDSPPIILSLNKKTE